MPLLCSGSLPRRYTPGPGTYSPKVDCKGGRSLRKGGFTMKGLNPDQSMVHHTLLESSSPGPIYIGNARKSSVFPALPNHKMAKEGVGARFNKYYGYSSSSPVWNPSPDTYDSTVNNKGGLPPALWLLSYATLCWPASLSRRLGAMPLRISLNCQFRPAQACWLSHMRSNFWKRQLGLQRIKSTWLTELTCCSGLQTIRLPG